MQGYRTVALNAVFALLGIGGVQFSDLPPSAQAWITLLAAAWGFAGIFVRLLTTTPIGQKAEAVLEHDLGITPEQMAELVAKLPEKADLAAIETQGSAVIAALADVKAVAAATHAAVTAPPATTPAAAKTPSPTDASQLAPSPATT